MSDSTESRRSPLGAIFLTVVVDLVGFGIVLPLLPRYARDFSASPSEIGLLLASFSAMQFLFAPLWGRVSDRIGRRPVLLVGLAGSVVFYTVFGLAPNLFWLFAARIGAGLAGATISISAAYIADVTPPRERARGMALIGAAFGIGFTAGPPIGGYAAHLGQTLHEHGALPIAIARGLPGFVAAALSLVSFFWTLRSVAEPARHASAARKVFDVAALRASLSVPGVAMLLGLSFFSVFAFSNFEGTISLMLKDRLRYDERSMGLVFLFIGVVLSVAQGVIVRKLVPRVGERAFTRAGFGLMAAGLAGVAFADRIGPLLAAIGVAVVGFGGVTPSLSSLISRRTDPARQGSMMGLAQSVSALGRILGPWFGNVIYGDAHPPLASLLGGLAFHRRPYVIAAVILGVLAVVSLAIPPVADAHPDEAASLTAGSPAAEPLREA
jgi:DHA1 family tetracycline resistance protein-like MFS transporter